jgi:hypothetical protein
MNPGKGAAFAPGRALAMKRTIARPCGGTLAMNAADAIQALAE